MIVMDNNTLLSKVQSRLENSRIVSALPHVVLVLVFGLGLAIRLYDLTDPPLDFHPTRQLRSALISRAVYYRLLPGVDPQLRQQAIDLGKLEIYEPPILENIVGFTYLVAGGEYFWLARIYNALFWMIGGWALYAIGRRLVQSHSAVVLGLAFYFFLPFGVIASRSFQPEPWMVMWILLTLYALLRWGEKPGWKWAVLVGVFGGMALLVKGVAGFFVAPMLGAAALAAKPLTRFMRDPKNWLVAGLTVLPAMVYMLFNQERTSEFLSFWTGDLYMMIFTTSFYARWLAMVKGLMSLSTFMAAILGVLVAGRSTRPLLAGAWIGYGLYGMVFPYQYITHEYYHLPLVALVALGVLPVLEALLNLLRKQGWVWRLLAVGVFVFAGAYSLWVARSILYAADHHNDPVSWRRVGDDLPENSRFVALTGDYGMRLRYYGWRIPSAFWPSGADLSLSALAGRDEMEFLPHFEQVTRGMDYFLVTALGEFEAQPDLKQHLTQNYPQYLEGSGYFIYDLTHPISD